MVETRGRQATRDHQKKREQKVMNNDDTNEIDLTILPKDKRLQFEALGTKKASKLIRKQIESDMRKGRTRAIELLEKSKALDSALAEGEEVHALWPDSLAE